MERYFFTWKLVNRIEFHMHTFLLFFLISIVSCTTLSNVPRQLLKNRYFVPEVRSYATN